jgi:TetR/AcrR family fatty acid metabolism transcriptional regulator
MARTVDRDARREQLISAAAGRIAQQGVAGTTVSDVVKAAGVAQGTFYLYFDSKDDVILAVVERFAETMASAVREAVRQPGVSAVDELRALCTALSHLIAPPGAEELVALMHEPGNRAIHDRLAEQITPKVVSLIEEIVKRGVKQGVFNVSDPSAAAWFLLSGLQGAEQSGLPLSELPAAFTTAAEFALRALGYSEPPLAASGTESEGSN